jgi:hypothetical protein
MTYRTAVEALDLVVVKEAEVGSGHRGDWIALVVDSVLRPNRGGMVIQPYGCCPACDEWDSSAGVDQRLTILNRIIKHARWFPTPNQMRNWVIESVAVEYPSFFGEEWEEFVSSLMSVLQNDSWAGVFQDLMMRDRFTCVEVCRESDVPSLSEVEAVFDA